MFAAHVTEEELPPGEVCAAWANLASVLAAMGDPDGADAAQRRAVAVLRRAELQELRPAHVG
ncbi:MAG: hypothetical protein ACJ77E_08905 [Gaiellaceae bacterium]